MKYTCKIPLSGLIKEQVESSQSYQSNGCSFIKMSFKELMYCLISSFYLLKGT